MFQVDGRTPTGNDPYIQKYKNFMKLLPWLLLIIGAGLVYVFWPEPKEPDYSLHEARIAQREQAYHSLSRDYHKLLLKIEADSVSRKIEVQAYKDRDKAKSREIARIKAKPHVVEIIRANPAIDTLLQAYDSLLESKDQQLNLQEKYVSTLQMDIGELKANFEERIALQDSTINDQREIITDLTNRLNKKKTVWQKLAQVGKDILKVGAGFLLGSQL